MIQRSRILFIDDEKPELIDDLQEAGYAVDHKSDIVPQTCHLIDQNKYDLILLDFGNVGKKFGEDEGLSLLRYIIRVNPTSVVISYTSKALPAKHADFFILTEGTLPKDAGISDSIEKIDEGLTKAHSIERNWNALLHELGIVKDSKEDNDLQDEYIRSLKNPKKSNLFEKKINTLTSRDSFGDATKEIATTIVIKLISIGAKGIIAAI